MFLLKFSVLLLGVSMSEMAHILFFPAQVGWGTGTNYIWEQYFLDSEMKS